MKYYKKNQKGKYPTWIECTETEYNQLPTDQRLKSFYTLIGA